MIQQSNRTDVQILAISVDPPQDGQKMVERIRKEYNEEISFPLLEDPGHRVIDRYGLLNPAAASRGLPHPAVFVIDKQGIVRWKFVETDYKVRATNAHILSALKSLR